MARFSILGKPVPLLGVAILVLLPVLGTTLGMMYPVGSVGGLDRTVTDPLPISGSGSQPEQPTDPPSPNQSAAADEPAVIIDSDGKGIQIENAPNQSQVTVRDDGTGFWFSTQTTENWTDSTLQLWVDINNTASVDRKARLTIKPESPLEVSDDLGTSPGSSTKIITEQQSSVSNIWTMRIAPDIDSQRSVTDEPIIAPEAIKHRTNHVVVDRNRDGNITTDDIDFANSDITDDVDTVDGLRLNDDNTATLYLNGSTDTDGTYDTVSYQSGWYLVIPVHVPEDTPPGSYTVEGEITTLQK